MKDEPQIPDEIKKMVAAGKVERPWQLNTSDNPFFNQKDRVEVKYKDGRTEIFLMPRAKQSIFSEVTHWRSAAIMTPPKIRMGSILGGLGARKPEIPKPKIMPAVYKGGVIKVEWFREFRLRERLAILFGANIVVMAGIACEHNVGKYQPMLIGKVSKHSTPDEHMREVIENMLVDKDSPVNQISQV